MSVAPGDPALHGFPCGSEGIDICILFIFLLEGLGQYSQEELVKVVVSEVRGVLHTEKVPVGDPESQSSLVWASTVVKELRAASLLCESRAATVIPEEFPPQFKTGVFLSADEGFTTAVHGISKA